MSLLSVFRHSTARTAALGIMLIAAAPLAGSPADARVGGGFSFGSRGSRTFSAPAPTQTAPRTAQPFQRSETPMVAPASRGFGFGSGLLAGLLGAGLMGSLFGGGFFYGIAAFIGLMFKLALIGGLIWLVLRLVRGQRRGPVTAGGPQSYARTGMGGQLPGGAPRRDDGPVAIGPDDYAAFEASLVAIQDAYGREDMAALSRLATPEVVRRLSGDLAENRQRGLRNDVSQARLVQGDLSEAWREGSVAYATVAMRFAAIDVMVERASGRIVSGDPVHPVEATELWTFRRDGGGWQLSGIQQAG